MCKDGDELELVMTEGDARPAERIGGERKKEEGITLEILSKDV